MSNHPEAEGIPSYEALLEENIRLKSELQALRERCAEASTAGDNDALYISEETPPPLAAVGTLTAEQVARYSRQLLVSDFGVQAQKTLLSSSALVIGAGRDPWTGSHSVQSGPTRHLTGPHLHVYGRWPGFYCVAVLGWGRHWTPRYSRL